MSIKVLFVDDDSYNILKNGNKFEYYYIWRDSEIDWTKIPLQFIPLHLMAEDLIPKILKHESNENNKLIKLIINE